MNQYVYSYQCEDCGKRFPRKYQLGRHIRRIHPTERVQCRRCHYSQPATDAYRVRKHELIHQKYLNLEPMATPNFPLDMVVVQSMTLVNDCDGMTIVVGLPLTDKSKGSSWNAPSLLMDLLLKSIGVLIGLLVIGTLV
jgi:DNA-directed RNA polymerase subunit RPC12/RpoP